jgi:hypothetical protein
MYRKRLSKEKYRKYEELHHESELARSCREGLSDDYCLEVVPPAVTS